MTWWAGLAETIWQLFEEYGLLTAFVLLVFEEAGVPPLIPGDFLMLLVGVQVATGKLSLLQAVLALEAATILGGSILYWVSVWGGHALVYRLGRYIGATAERLDAAGASLERHGARAVVLGRLVPGLSNLTTIGCGTLGFPFRRFLPALALGGFLRLVVFVGLGYGFGPPVLELAARLHLPIEMLISSVVFLGLAGWLARAARAERIEREARPSFGERLHSGALAGMLGAIESTLLVNVLLHLSVLIAYDAPGAALEASGLLARNAAPTLALLIAPAFVLLPILWGALYGGWGSVALRGPGWRRGLIFALAPLAVSLLIVLPLLGAGPFGVNIGAGPIPALGEVVRHLVYGLVLGVTFAALGRRQPRRLLRRAIQPA